jgi:tRNA-dihydrouridine synthase A
MCGEKRWTLPPAEFMTSTLETPASAAAHRGVLRPLSAAPMMDRTDRHFRYLLRQITRHTLLYTEMVTTGAILEGRRLDLLAFDEAEKPLALQLGGDSPDALAACARIAEDLGYDEVNLNVGCPSDRVQKGRFGACLMAEPAKVAACVAAMRSAVGLPVTVKHRIGVDDLDRYEDLARFVETVAEAGCDRFSVHARKAWLEGLSPKENREVPPLRYEDVHRLKRELPHLRIEVNGGIRTLADAQRHLDHADGVMIGRAAYDDPYLFSAADAEVFASPEVPPSRREVVEKMIAYAGRRLAEGLPLARVSRHLLSLFAGQPGTRAWKRHLSENACRPEAGVEVLRDAMERIPVEVLDAQRQ